MASAETAGGKRAAQCAAAAAPALPPLASAGYDDFGAIRALVDAGRLGAARARWASLTGWAPAAGATAYGRADAAFSARAYRTAFISYYRAIFCGRSLELNPSAQDSGAAAQLARALLRAGAGDLTGAQRILEHAAHSDPSSIESRYFLGLIECARGERQAARATWKAAIDDRGYAQPPDGWTLPRAQQAALERYLTNLRRSSRSASQRDRRRTSARKPSKPRRIV